MRHYILPLMALMLAVSCFKDNSTLDTVRISKIHIDTLKLQKEYNIDKNETLPIAVDITQENRDLPLKYEWEVGYKLYSEEPELEYVGQDLGSFPARLKISNEHGSAFYEFTINVNSPYEEGITLLSRNADGEMMLSMMRTYTPEELAAGKTQYFNTHLLTLNNPEIVFAKGPTDIVKRASQLFISCTDSPHVYVVNDKTLEMENIVQASEYPNFEPRRMMIFEDASRSAPTICSDGTVYNLASLEQEVLPHTMLTSNYAQVNHGYPGYQVAYHLWDNDQQLLAVYNGYDVFTGSQFNPPYKGHQPIAMFDNVRGATFTMITAKDGAFWQTTITNSGKKYDDNYAVVGIDMSEHFKIDGTPAITAATPIVSSPTYLSMFYAVGNTVYRKYFSDTAFPAAAWATIPLQGAEITALAVSPDDTQLYVGVREAGSGELDGHVYIFNIRTGAQETGSPYLKVGYTPVKIMYKVK